MGRASRCCQTLLQIYTIALKDTVAFLVATSDATVGQDLRDKMAVITSNWEELFQYVEKYMHVGDVTR